MDDHEQHTDVALLLRRAADEAPPDLDPSAAVAGAVRRGQRLRRRRAQGQWLGAVAVAATIAVVVLVHDWVQPRPRESVTLAPTESASPKVITQVPPAARGHRSVTAIYTEVVSTYGEVRDVTSYPYGEAGQRMAQGSLVDSSGPGAVNVSVARDTTTADEAVGCEVTGTAVTSCRTLPEGSACPRDLRCLSPADGVAEACPRRPNGSREPRPARSSRTAPSWWRKLAHLHGRARPGRVHQRGHRLPCQRPPGARPGVQRGRREAGCHPQRPRPRPRAAACHRRRPGLGGRGPRQLRLDRPQPG